MQSEGLNVDDEVLILGAALQMALLCVSLKGKAAGGGQTQRGDSKPSRQQQ